LRRGAEIGMGGAGSATAPDPFIVGLPSSTFFEKV
jgi:hypothetical protein